MSLSWVWMQASYRELIALDGREGGAHFISSSTFGRIVLEAKQPPGNALLSSFLSSPCFCLSTAICLRCLLQARPRSPSCLFRPLCPFSAAEFQAKVKLDAWKHFDVKCHRTVYKSFGSTTKVCCVACESSAWIPQPVWTPWSRNGEMSPLVGVCGFSSA